MEILAKWQASITKTKGDMPTGFGLLIVVWCLFVLVVGVAGVLVVVVIAVCAV